MIIKIGNLNEDGSITSYEYFQVKNNLRIYTVSNKVAKVVKSGDGKRGTLFRFLNKEWVESKFDYQMCFLIEKFAEETFVNYINFTDGSGENKSVVASEHLVYVMNDDGKTIDRY